MVEAIQKGMTVNPHPQKQFVKRLIGVQYIGCTNLRLVTCKADRLVMCNAVTKNVDSVQLIEDIGVVILNFC